MTSGFLPRAVVSKGPLACLAPPNRGGLNSIHIHGTSVPVEEPSTASESGHMHRSKRSARVQCLIRSLRRRALAITNWGCKSSIRNQLQGYSMRNSSLSGRRRPSTTEPLRMLRDTSCLSFCARPALYGVCASLTSLLARGFRPRRPLRGRPDRSRYGCPCLPPHCRGGPRAPWRSPHSFRLGRGRTGSLVLRRNFRRGGLQSRADVLPRAGTGPLGVSSGASCGRPGGGVGEYGPRALL